MIPFVSENLEINDTMDYESYNVELPNWR